MDLKGTIDNMRKIAYKTAYEVKSINEQKMPTIEPLQKLYTDIKQRSELLKHADKSNEQTKKSALKC